MEVRTSRLELAEGRYLFFYSKFYFSVTVAQFGHFGLHVLGAAAARARGDDQQAAAPPPAAHAASAQDTVVMNSVHIGTLLSLALLGGNVAQASAAPTGGLSAEAAADLVTALPGWEGDDGQPLPLPSRHFSGYLLP